MLIISKKKDYYDGVVGTMGVDKTIVYNREVKEFTEYEFPEPFKRKVSDYYVKQVQPFLKLGGYNTNKSSNYQDYNYFIVGFCGKLYIGWKLYTETKSAFTNNNIITTITYDFDNVNEILDCKRNGYYGNLSDHVKNVLDYDPMYLFRELNTPIFIYDNDFNRTFIGRFSKGRNPKFIINPNLNDYEFYKVFDSFQAFQEIQMFLGGVLGNHEKEIIEVADKYKIEQHGFDKWSFRKEKENKKCQ